MSASILARMTTTRAVPPVEEREERDRAAWPALAVWAIMLPLAFLAPNLNPFRVRIAMIPLEIGMVLLAGAAVILRRKPLISAAAGLYAGWVALTLRMSLAGTPYGFDGLYSDAVRLTAMATRFSATWHSADGIVGTVPSEYPPLYPWLIGRTSALTGVDAWRLMGPAAVIVMSGAVVAAYLLWRRMVPDLAALAIAVVSLAVDNRPEKAHEVIALMVVVPWLLGAFAEPPRGRLHWLPAGVIGGLVVLTYQGYVMFAALAIIALVAIHRRFRHTALTIVVAAVTASWFVGPYLWWGATHGMEMTDTYQSTLMMDSPFPFLDMTTPVSVLELIGLAGLVYYRTREWWAWPLLLLTLSCYGYRLLAMAGFTLNGETHVFQYVNRMLIGLLVAAGILTLVRAVPAIRPVQAGMAGAAVAVLIGWAGYEGWLTWMPGQPVNETGRYMRAASEHYNATSRAFAQSLPNGARQARAPRGLKLPGLPITAIQRDVQAVRGKEAAPSVLSYSEALYAYLPWNGYLPVAMSCTGGPVHWFSRYRYLQGLTRTTDPEAFAQKSAGINVFLLRSESGGKAWTWRPWDWSSHLTFTPAQFSPARFMVFQLPDSTVLAVRR
jgi:hypothetical protein